MGAGAVGKSLIGRLSARSVDLGPVAGVSYRVASRIANTLKGGFAVREPLELKDAGAVLFHAPSDQMSVLFEGLTAAKIEWSGRSVVFCDCEATGAMVHQLRHAGASVAVARQFGLPSQVVVEGAGRALLVAHRLAREARLKALEIRPGSSDLFDAAVTLSTCAITPLVDGTAALLRAAGVRDPEAPRLAAALFEQTAHGYAHSGKQSWGWYMQIPEVHRVLAQLDAAEPDVREVFRTLLLFGVEVFGKHPDLAAALRAQFTAE